MKMERIPLLRPAPGSQRFLQVYTVGPENSNSKVYIQAGLHADEWPGLLVIQHLLPKLEQLESAGQLNAQFIVVPFANPIGLDQQLFGDVTGRHYHENGQNFNRQMSVSKTKLAFSLDGKLTSSPDSNVQVIRETLKTLVRQSSDHNEIQTLHKTLLSLSIDADLVLDLHCDLKSLPHLFGASFQKDQSIELAQSLDFPVVLHEDLTGDVAFDGTHTQPWLHLQQTYPEFPIPAACFAATIELRGKHDVSDSYAQQDANSLVQYLIKTNYVAGQPKKAFDPQYDQPKCFSIDNVLIVPSPSHGIVVYHLEPGDTVAAGEVFAEIVLLDADEANSRTPIKSQYAGYIISQTHKSLVRPGTTIAMIGCDQSTGREGYQLAD